MDHIPSLPASRKGNTELLIWVNLFTGFVIAKTSASRTAQTVAESYEEAAFRRFGASETIRHDREPGFMSEFFKAFNKLIGQRQRDNARRSRPVLKQTGQHNACDQRDWDQYAERLTYALNTAHDRTRDETPLFSRARLGSAVYVGRDACVKRGYARKLAHMCHGPFLVAQLVSAYDVRLEIHGTPCQLFPIVHVSKLKPVREFPSRPELQLTVPSSERFDFDEELLPEDS
ncbi:reverse transcriptase [Phytophthora megakarya]|uniref:Reverse transcriptase n=1 Tax=Phytophthora megakarya TaxID=4795 RepID=A0A225VZS4_9STRA|nr:reverse transcriptase [Phytophthora megakarya]